MLNQFLKEDSYPGAGEESEKSYNLEEKEEELRESEQKLSFYP